MQIILTSLARQLQNANLTDPDNGKVAKFRPTLATEGSAGYDIRACIAEPITIPYGETILVPTGFHCWIQQPDLVGKIYARSGLASKQGLHLANGVGIVDSDYQDEWKVALTARQPSFLNFLSKVCNAFYENYDQNLHTFITAIREVRNHNVGVTIYPSQRIAQVLFEKVEHPAAEEVDEFLSKTTREGGFGSTNVMREDLLGR